MEENYLSQPLSSHFFTGCKCDICVNNRALLEQSWFSLTVSWSLGTTEAAVPKGDQPSATMTFVLWSRGTVEWQTELK